MAVDLEKHLFTVAEFERMIAAGIFGEDDRVELIEGEVIHMAAIGRRHAECVRASAHELGRQAGASALVDVQNPIDLGPLGRPQPDIVLLRPGLERYRGRLPTAADVLLVVEVADTSLRSDRARKIPLYGRAGIPEAWLVDVVNDRLFVDTEPCPEGYRVTRTIFPGEVVAPTSFPHWQILLEDVLPLPGDD